MTLQSDIARLEEALLACTISMPDRQVIFDFGTREAAEKMYERLTILLVNSCTGCGVGD